MSLINQMLRDLEARRSDDLSRQNLQREIKALPLPPPERNLGRPIGLGLGAILAGLGTWYGYSQYFEVPPAPPAPPPAVAAAVVQPLPEPAPVPPLQAMLPPDAGALKEPVSANPAPAEIAGKPDLPSGNAIHRPAAPPSPPAAPKAAMAPVAAGPVPARPQAPAPIAKATSLPKAGQEEKPAGPIEKVPVAATSRERAELEYRKAVALVTSGRGGEAIDSLQAALSLDAGHQGARQVLAKLLLEAKRGDEAANLLRDGLELQPAQIGWAMALARLQVERGDHAAAARTLVRSQPHASRQPDYLGFLGYVQKQLGQNREAVASYQAAVQLAPMEGRWWLGLGLALEADGQTQTAGEAYRRALASGNLSPELAAVAAQKTHQN